MYGNMFSGLVTGMILVGVAIGGVLFVAIPWLWRLLKPWIHAVTG
jgi:hypothetical protein